MSTLNVTNTYIAGTLAKASEVNTNFSDIVSWANGNIGEDNLDTFTGQLNWNITTGVKAISISNSGNEGSISINQTSALSPNKSSLSITNSAAETSSLAGVYINLSSVSSTVPALRVDYKTFTNLSVDPDGLRGPSRTTVQRDASSPGESEILYNNNKKEYQVYDSERWAPIGLPTGTVLDFAGSTAPDGFLGCDGAAVSRTTYAKLFAVISTTYGVGDGSTTFNLPDSRGRASIGSGTGSGLTARALAATGGEENHVLTEAELATHDHSVTDPGHYHFEFSSTITGSVAGSVTSADQVYRLANDGGSNTSYSTQPTADAATVGRSSVEVTSLTVDNAGSNTAHNTMQPFIVFNKIIKA